MIRIGIVGLGVMGRTHLASFAGNDRCRVVAVATKDAHQHDHAGNIDGHGVAEIPADAGRYDDAELLFADDEVDAVSICVPTPLHAGLTIDALRAGRHVLCEKPLARSSAECAEVIEVAAAHPNLVCLPAMCMRFWPGWTWLKEAIDSGRYGDVQSATFTRLGGMPDWNSAFYGNPDLSGGAILDLHIHDADFIRYCFGDPTAVTAQGTTGPRGGLNHVITQYHFRAGPMLVAAEGGWMTGRDYSFDMRYRVNFETATAEFALSRDEPLQIWAVDGEPTAVPLGDGTGYDGEIAHFLDCIERGVTSDIVTMTDGARAVALVDAERQSIRERHTVQFTPVV